MDAVDTQRTEENEAAASTPGPITDKTRTTTEPGDAGEGDEVKASSSTSRDVANEELTTSANANSSSNPNSKIPHPTLAALLASKTNQFRRSASLRLRGSKSNLLFNTFASNNSNTNTNNKNSDSHNTTNSNPHTRGDNKLEHTTITKSAANPTTARTGSAMAEPEVAHDLATTAGRVSPRRKLVLNSQLPAVGLARSLSLRSRSQNRKTDSNAESCTVPESSRDSPTKDNTGNCVSSQDIGDHHRPAETPRKDPPDQGIKEADTNDESPEKAKANAGNEITPRQGDADEPGAQVTQQQDNHKMSLTLNGPTTTAPTTTTTTNARPSSLATSAPTGGSSNSSSKAASARTTSAAPRTPKTPTTPQLTNHHNHSNHSHAHSVHHHHHNHQPCSKQPQQVSPSAPEKKLTPRTPPVTPDSPSTYLEDDLDSLYSFATTTSGRSTMSCEHPYVARNGTTFSGRKMKYVVHCSNHAGQVGPDYLTPTQRAQRQIRRLKELLSVARQDLEQKDSEILRLTREVVELRLFKASLSSPEDRSASSDAVTVREADLKTSQDVSPIVDMVDDAAKSSPRHILGGGVGGGGCQAIMQQHSEMQSSFADSGHFDDMTTSSVHSKDSYAAHTHDMACGSDEVSGEADGEAADGACGVESYEMQRQELIRMYEQRIEELIRTQDSSVSDMKRSHNDKVEALLQKLAECNTRYADIVPDYEHAKERIRELEKQLEDLQRKLAEHEEKQNKMYLHMYQKGQEAERIARADQALELAHRAPSNKVSINELLHQLQSTQDELENIRAAECRNETGGNHALLTAKEAISLWVLGARKTIYRRLLDAQKNRTHVDPEVTLQFLKSAVYYFLTDKENSQGHLQAIESILEFTEVEKQNINKARSPK